MNVASLNLQENAGLTLERILVPQGKYPFMRSSRVFFSVRERDVQIFLRIENFAYYFCGTLLVQIDIYLSLLTETLAGGLSVASSINIPRTKPCDFLNASSFSRTLSVIFLMLFFLKSLCFIIYLDFGGVRGREEMKSIFFFFLFFI